MHLYKHFPHLCWPLQSLPPRRRYSLKVMPLCSGGIIVISVGWCEATADPSLLRVLLCVHIQGYSRAKNDDHLTLLRDIEVWPDITVHYAILYLAYRVWRPSDTKVCSIIQHNNINRWVHQQNYDTHVTEMADVFLEGRRSLGVSRSCTPLVTFYKGRLRHDWSCPCLITDRIILIWSGCLMSRRYHIGVPDAWVL